jgi:hypothetical protein
MGYYSPRPVCLHRDIILLGRSIRDGLLFPSAGLFATGTLSSSASPYETGYYSPQPVCLNRDIILLGRSVCDGVLFTLADPYVADHYSPHRAWLAHHQFRPTHCHQKIYVVRPTRCRRGTGRRRVARLRWHIVNSAVRSTMGVLY